MCFTLALLDMPPVRFQFELNVIVQCDSLLPELVRLICCSELLREQIKSVLVYWNVSAAVENRYVNLGQGSIGSVK